MKCKTCKHFEKRNADGRCKANPPISDYKWPAVTENDGCGKFEEATPKKANGKVK